MADTNADNTGRGRRSILVLLPLATFLALAALFFFRLGTSDPSRLPSALIGQRVAERVPDGATLQAGIGAIPDAALACLTGHRGLRVWTEMFSDGVLALGVKDELPHRRPRVRRLSRDRRHQGLDRVGLARARHAEDGGLARDEVADVYADSGAVRP